MAAVSMMSSQEGGLMSDFSPEDDGYFTCAVSVQHKVSQGAVKGWREKETSSVIVLISSKVTAGGQHILNIHC